MIHSKVPGRRLLLGLAMAVVAVVATTTATAAVGKATATPIKFAIMSDCGGAFAANYEQDIGGAITAVSQFGGAKPNNPNKPSAGWHGGSVGGHPLKLVGIGCANDTADSAIKETKRLMEQLGADVMIGPLSGDESVAVANYAKQHPTKTFVNGTAGAWDTTAAVKAPNFFRFNGSGVQWQAGIGSIATKKNKWKKAAIIMDDYSFGYASGAGFIADFCAAGGNITKRVFPPLNTTDYSSFVQQLPAPDKVDGYFWAIGGTGTVPSIKAFENLYGPLKAFADHREPVLLLVWRGQGDRPAPERRLRRRLRYGTGPEGCRWSRSTRGSSTSGSRSTRRSPARRRTMLPMGSPTTTTSTPRH